MIIINIRVARGELSEVSLPIDWLVYRFWFFRRLLGGFAGRLCWEAWLGGFAEWLCWEALLGGFAGRLCWGSLGDSWGSLGGSWGSLGGSPEAQVDSRFSKMRGSRLDPSFY